MSVTNDQNPSVHAAIQLLEGLTDQEKLIVLGKVFDLGHDFDNQVIVYTNVYE